MGSADSSAADDCIRVLAKSHVWYQSLDRGLVGTDAFEVVDGGDGLFLGVASHGKSAE